MIWPFLLVYASEKLNAPLTAVASLLTINAAVGLVSSFLGGPVVDRFGRKWVMVLSLATNGIGYYFLSQADIMPQFIILLAFMGAANPLYRVGADAMMADLVPEPNRPEGYSLMRLSNNLGISIGPAIGGFIASASYSLAFYFAAAGMIIYSLLLVFLAHETLPGSDHRSNIEEPIREPLGGYLTILRDRQYIGFIGAFTLVSICATLIWVLLPVYATQTYQIPKSMYGWIPTTNAAMVVTLQLLFTRYTKRYTKLLVMAIGSVFYTIAVGSVAIGTTFIAFWISMVIMTIGELILVPTSSTFVANLAPVDKRGRYMSLYTMTWGVAAGIGPIFGGILNDRIGPTAIWYGGALAGIASVSFFLYMFRLYPEKKPLVEKSRIDDRDYLFEE